MTAVSLPRPAVPLTLVDRVLPSSRPATNALLVAAGASVVAVLAQVQIPLWPVPITGQTLGVMLVGAALGARRGALALTVYMLAGLAGLPVFAGFKGGPLSVLTPSFGFIVGFILSAALIGWLSERKWDRHPVRSLAGFLAASIVPFIVGLPYMAVVLRSLALPHDPIVILQLGVVPFLIGGAIKWLIAAALLPAVWHALRQADQRRRGRK